MTRVSETVRLVILGWAILGLVVTGVGVGVGLGTGAYWLACGWAGFAMGNFLTARSMTKQRFYE